MDNIIEPTIDYDFQQIQLGMPISQPSSTYLTKIYVNSKPLYIQTPKCSTRGGFIKVGKKIYCDLMFTNDENIFVNWMENLENRCQELIFSKGEAWFQNAMEKSDIETAFTSPLKIYKSGKFYLLRVNVKPNVKIYNDSNTEIVLEDIKPEINLISILEIQGIKFTSRNFQIEIELKQSMVVSPDPFLDACFIKKAINHHQPLSQPQQVVKPLEVTSFKESPDISQIVNNILKMRTEPIKEDIPIEQVVTIQPPTLETNFDELSEVDLEFSLDNLESITLKKPNHVYYQMYKEIKDRAKKAELEAQSAYLEAQTLKEKYMLDTDSDESDTYSNNDETDSDF
jgi:hypothetical protein